MTGLILYLFILFYIKMNMLHMQCKVKCPLFKFFWKCIIYWNNITYTDVKLWTFYFYSFWNYVWAMVGFFYTDDISLSGQGGDTNMEKNKAKPKQFSVES